MIIKKEYNLLFSSPGDVVHEGVYKTLKKKIDELNRDFFPAFKTYINLVQWKENTIPDSSKAPQPSINQQLVDRCDFGVAVFHNRFGTPTASYGSGTEEEIALLQKQAKPVFIYFIRPSKFPLKRSEQQQKVASFKAKLQHDAFVWDVTSRKEFINQFIKHLMTIVHGVGDFRACFGFGV